MPETSTPVRMREERVLKYGSFLLLSGISLIGAVLLAPNSAGQPVGLCFFKIAASGTWGKTLDFPTAWCSVKILLLCLGSFLVIESIATILCVLNRKGVALLVYCLHFVPVVGVLLGSYCLFRALL